MSGIIRSVTAPSASKFNFDAAFGTTKGTIRYAALIATTKETVGATIGVSESIMRGCKYNSVPVGSKITVMAEEYGSNDNGGVGVFSHWEKDGVKVSEHLLYTFIADSTTTLTAKYLDGYTKPCATIWAWYNATNLDIMSDFVIPSGAKLKYMALIATTKDSVGYGLTYENCSYIKGKSNPTVKELRWSGTNIKEGQTWYVRPYYKYVLDGKTYKGYGEVIAVKLVGGKLICVNPVTEPMS